VESAVRAWEEAAAWVCFALVCEAEAEAAAWACYAKAEAEAAAWRWLVMTGSKQNLAHTAAGSARRHKP
jgi:hypothetical protein